MTYRDCELINAVAAMAATADIWGVIERSQAYDNKPPVLFVTPTLGERVVRLCNIEPDVMTEENWFFPLDKEGDR